jgi:hypothetical protein
MALLGALLPFGGHGERGDVQVHHYRVAGWRLEVRDNRFTGVVNCTVEKPDIVYSHGVFDFQFGPTVDTANALFRVDYGVVHTAGSVAVEAAGMGARFDGPNLANPSDGEVRIPAIALGDAHTVLIKPNGKMNHRLFDLTGLSTAIQAAKARKCDVA